MSTLSIKYSKYDLSFFWTLGKDEKLAIKKMIRSILFIVVIQFNKNLLINPSNRLISQ